MNGDFKVIFPIVGENIKESDYVVGKKTWHLFEDKEDLGTSYAELEALGCVLRQSYNSQMRV